MKSLLSLLAFILFAIPDDPRTDTQWTGKTKLHSSIANGGQTGVPDSVEDTWKGDVRVTPIIVIVK